MKPDYPLSKEQFDAIYSKVVRLSVEVLIYEKDRGVFLTKRDIEPCKGQWHLPGGTVVFGEPVKDTVKRIAKREVGVDVKKSHLVGYIDYPSHYKNGLDSPVSMVFEIDEYDGKPQFTTEATDGKWFMATPKNMHADQDVFLLKNGYFGA
jgi:ADP-ribose pyrophosphatase YjhB (NUDIX family)